MCRHREKQHVCSTWFYSNNRNNHRRLFSIPKEKQMRWFERFFSNLVLLVCMMCACLLASVFMTLTNNVTNTIIKPKKKPCWTDDSIFFLLVENIEGRLRATMQPGGQSLVDRLLAAKNTIAGQALAKVVCKATTEEIMGPKRKHLDCKCSDYSFSSLSTLIRRSSLASDQWNERVDSSIGWFTDWTDTELLLGGFIQILDHYSSFDVLWKWSKVERWTITFILCIILVH